MGADLILAAVPYCAATKERVKQFREVLQEISDEEIVQAAHSSQWSDYVVSDAARMIREEIVQTFESGDVDRQCVAICFQGMNYDMLIAGGMSWGEEPSDGYRDVEALSEVPSAA